MNLIPNNETCKAYLDSVKVTSSYNEGHGDLDLSRLGFCTSWIQFGHRGKNFATPNLNLRHIVIESLFLLKLLLIYSRGFVGDLVCSPVIVPGVADAVTILALT